MFSARYRLGKIIAATIVISAVPQVAALMGVEFGGTAHAFSSRHVKGLSKDASNGIIYVYKGVRYFLKKAKTIALKDEAPPSVVTRQRPLEASESEKSKGVAAIVPSRQDRFESTFLKELSDRSIRPYDPRARDSARTPGDRVMSHAVFVALPDDEVSYKNVFGRLPSARDMAEMLRAKRKMSALSRDHHRHADLYHFLMHSQSDFISIIGHNDHGTFHLTNGRNVKLADALDKCGEFKKICIFLTCNARTAFKRDKIDYALAVDAVLTYDQAAETAAIINKYITEKKNSDASEREIVDHLPETVESALAAAKQTTRLQLYVKVSSVATPTATIIGAIVTVPDAADSSRRSVVR